MQCGQLAREGDGEIVAAPGIVPQHRLLQGDLHVIGLVCYGLRELIQRSVGAGCDSVSEYRLQESEEEEEHGAREEHIRRP
jgi:hypothetical protein